jgi:hypothetical protein
VARKSGESQLFYDQCTETLYSYWNEILETDINQDFIPEIRQPIESILRTSDKSYRYALPTQLLAKLTDDSLDSRCIQETRTNGEGNFNARDVCKNVIVPWERKEGIPLGQSNDPYVNNPLRVPEFSDAFRGNRKDVETWDLLCNIFAEVEERKEEAYTINLFKQVLLEIRRIQEESQVNYVVPMRISLKTTKNALDLYLNARSGGARLQAVLVALFRTFKSKWNIYEEVFSAPVNVPDTPGGRPADIDCRKDGETILAVEVKDTTLTLQLLEDKIRSCRANAVTELMFLIRANPLVGEGVDERVEKEFTTGLNIYTIEAIEFLNGALSILGESARREFLINIGSVGEELKLEFNDRKQWAEILSTL